MKLDEFEEELKLEELEELESVTDWAELWRCRGESVEEMAESAEREASRRGREAGEMLIKY